MRLIDADSFKNLVTAVSIAKGHPAGFVNKFCELINSQPTAYDVGKVVERIENLSLDGISMIEDGKYSLVRKNEVLEIVHSELNV